MFLGREKELSIIKNELNSNHKTVIMIYGKRRIGKSTLICVSSRNFDGVVINHQCIRSSYKGNIDFLSKSICNALGLPEIHFSELSDIFHFLGKQARQILLVLDEYQYLKNSLRNGEVDSVMQAIVDRLPSNVKLVLCGSYISIMKELLTENNPLFGRFTSIIHLKEMDYFDAAKFMDGYSNQNKIAAYAVFGGSPYVLSQLDYTVSVKQNITQLLLPENSILSTYIENVTLAEIKNAFDIRILEIIGNGKKKYSEILCSLDIPDNGNLDKQLGYLLKMNTIQKVYPINKKNDKKKTFYEMNDNLMRFYFAMIFGNVGLINILGEEQYYRDYIASRINTFISLRFEDVVKQYFARIAKMGQIDGIRDIGSLWYDEPKKKKNGQFDCVLQIDEGYEIFEAKLYEKPMSASECSQEILQIRAIPGLDSCKIGFVCSAGFETREPGVTYIEMEDLFK